MSATRIDVFNFARLQAILLALVGACAGILYSFGGALYDILTTGLNTGSYLAMLALVGIPVLFGLSGLILGLIEAALFNLIATRLNGIILDIKQEGH